MRPILMKGHERPLTFLKYNRDGDLLFSCAKDHNPTVWFADNGERLGDSSRLITGSADQTVKLWDVKKGEELHTFKFDSPARSVDFSIGDKLVVITTDPFMEKTSAIHVYRIAEDDDEQSDEAVLVMRGPNGRINRAVWGPLNKTIISCGEDAIIRVWDPTTGEEIMSTKDHENGHKKPITSLCLSADKSHFLTGSLDKSAKVVLGGGQEASHVTTTDHRAGKFEAKFYDKILTAEIGGVKGHFGPINALAFNPDGKSFASGGEDGYVRLHHFDPDYFHIKL
uniref:Eukaryotic translation initiation factor 3 subunit I n=1 Tax=Chenopodium quinoa TaxID=63459 RepID=A0A803M5K8_CHEQI